MPSDSAPSIAERIRRDIGRLTPNEKKAAHRLLADYPAAGLDTAARFGEASGVSAPTVLRMVAKLGLPSYGAFQEALRQELAARRQTPLMKGGDATRGNRLAGFSDAVLANLRATAANLPTDEFDAVAALLADAKRPVHVLGGRFTDALADYLVAHLRVLRPQVRRVLGQRSTWLDQLLDIGKRDVFVLFDIRRYSEDLVDFADKAARRGATVVLVTDQWLSPVSKVASHVLPAHVAVPSVWDSSAGLLLLIEALLAAVAGELGPAVRDRLGAVEAMRGD